jgi:hypothetical protein
MRDPRKAHTRAAVPAAGADTKVSQLSLLMYLICHGKEVWSQIKARVWGKATRTRATL